MYKAPQNRKEQWPGIKELQSYFPVHGCWLSETLSKPWQLMVHPITESMGRSDLVISVARCMQMSSAIYRGIYFNCCIVFHHTNRIHLSPTIQVNISGEHC